MAAILLNEIDSGRQVSIKTCLEKQGHKVWLAEYLGEINTILNAVPIQLLILDLDKENLEALLEFAERWKGVKILFQTSRFDFQQDFRSWMADEFIYKRPDMQNVMNAAKKLLMSSNLSN